MRVFIILCVAALLLPGLGCQNDPAVPPGSSGTNPSSNLDIPEPVLVPYAHIPCPPPPRLYRVAGAALADGPEVILERVVAGEFDLRRAWYPRVNSCMAPFLDELIIELGEPDDAIYELGFTSDFTGTAGPCASHWDEYDFVE